MSDNVAKPRSFEMGPIRPPNEATSLLLRVTRNCPWNRCSFCPVYKGKKFSLRSPEEVKLDIAAMAEIAARVEAALAAGEGPPDTLLFPLLRNLPEGALQVARFILAGGKTVFLQDANSVIMPVDGLVDVLECLRAAFPAVERVTTYARSHTIRLRSVEELTRLREAGLDRIHIGLESGSDRVLELIDKGITGERHIEAGLKVKAAGMELSEYVMPGLGGKGLWREHATETARVLREIDPHFIRLRSLAIRQGTPLAELRDRGELEPLDDIEVAGELRLMLEGMTGMTSRIRSDHILNLLEEIEGDLPGDHARLIAVVDRFLALPPDDRDAFIVGRRLGLLRNLDDLDDPQLRARIDQAVVELKRHFPGELAAAVRELMTRFV